MEVNKVKYNGDVLIDLTNDTVTSDDLPAGVTAHNASGVAIMGNNGVTQKLYSQVIDLNKAKGYDENTYYIIRGDTAITSDRFSHIIVHSTLGESNIPSWSDHKNGYSCTFDFFIQAFGWGANNGDIFIREKTWKWNKDFFYPVIADQDGASSRTILYLRGGGRYIIYSDYNTTWEEIEPYTTGNNEIKNRFTTENMKTQKYSCNLYGTISNATMDAQNRVIHETYATKIELGARTIKTWINGKVVSEVDPAIETLYNTLADFSICDFILNMQVEGYSLDGGGWYCKIFRATSANGYIEAKKYGYTSANQVEYKIRSKTNGIWGDWIDMMAS